MTTKEEAYGARYPGGAGRPLDIDEIERIYRGDGPGPATVAIPIEVLSALAAERLRSGAIAEGSIAHGMVSLVAEVAALRARVEELESAARPVGRASSRGRGVVPL